MVRTVTDSSFELDVLSADRPTLVEFGASWCPPCRAIAPVLEAIAAEREQLSVMTLDVEASPLTQARFRVMSLPTLILFSAGHAVGQAVGYRSKVALTRFIDETLAGAAA